MTIKPALSVIEQIRLLETRGMVIPDTQAAEAFLLRNNYYRLNIYFHKCMQTENQFEPGLAFEDVAAAYQFDRWLRHQLLILLESIEIHIKTRIAYYLARTYGSDCFYKIGCFKEANDFSRVVRDFENERNRNYQDPVVIHHETVYSGKYPVWVIIEFLSFKGTSNLYGCLHERDKKRIAQDAYGINENFLGQWIHVLSVLRNICAHYGYLFRREFSVRPRLFREFGWDTSNNGSLFAINFVLRRLSEKSSWTDYTSLLYERASELKRFSLADYGFPADWRRYLT